jgi:hypothetical protein
MSSKAFRNVVKLNDLVSVKDYGAVGDGVTNDAFAIQSAIAANKVVFIPGGMVCYIASTITISSEITIFADGAELIGPGVNSSQDLFSVNAAIDFYLFGGVFKNARRAVGFSAAKNVTIENASFSNLGHAVAVNTGNSTVTSSGILIVNNCKFDDMEIGVNIQSSRFAHSIVANNSFTNLGEKTIGTRSYPFDKKIVSGLWYQSLSGDCSVVAQSNYVDGVTEFLIPSSEPEAHGLAITLSNSDQTDAILVSNTVKNVFGSSVQGVEGLMGRGTRVIISNNVLLNAGVREGMIYAKGSTYHKISENILEATGTPDINLKGIISTGSNCDITNNKFINLPVGIQSRALASVYRGNEFINCTTLCINLALEAGAIHQHTVCENNYADENCGGFFSDGTAGSEIYGDFTFKNNILFNAGRSLSLKGGVTAIFSGNTVNRKTPNSSRECFLFDGVVSKLIVSNNFFVSFEDSSNTGRVFTSSNNTLDVTFSNNLFGTGDRALWLRDRTYTQLIVDNNDFFGPFNTSAVNASATNTTASEMLSFFGNKGVPPKTLIYAIAALPSTPKAGYRAWISDSSVNAVGVTAAGGGSFIVPVIYDGSNYIVSY